MNIDTEGSCIAALFSAKCPKGKVRFWVDDGQGGGWVDYLTPEEAERRYADLDAWDAGGERPDWM